MMHSVPPPRTLHSIHPGLRRMAAMASAPEAAAFPEPGIPHPYPTAAQYAATENAYRTALAAKEQDATPPVRQPPTMLAAMQRTDLTPEARRKMLAGMAPKPALEKRHKITFSSDARRDPLHSSTSDFTIDVAKDVLPTRAHGFEVVGYSLPAAEWTLAPRELALPWRHGWCASPGGREYRLSVRTLASPGGPQNWLGAASAAATQASSAQPLFGRPRDLVAEQPLVANPILAVRTDPEFAGHLRITLARRAGAALGAVAEQLQGGGAGGVWLELGNLAHGFPATSPPLPAVVQLRREHILEVVQRFYVDADPADGQAGAGREPLLGIAVGPAEAEQLADAASAQPLESPHVISVNIAAAAGVTPEPGEGAALAEGDALGALGRLVVLPPESADALARRLSAQLATLLEHRRFLEQQQPDLPRLALRSAAVRWVVEPYPLGARPSPSPPHVHRFALALGWQFGERDEWVRQRLAEAARGGGSGGVDPDLCPLYRLSGDADWIRKTQLPSLASLRGLDAEHHAAEPDSLLLVSNAPPEFPYPGSAPRLPALADGTSSPDAYFRALQSPAAALLFGPSAGNAAPSPSLWQVPVRTSDGVLHRIGVASGEYDAFRLARILTRAARALPALASLRLAVEPVLDPETRGTVLGFRFSGRQAFSLAWDVEDPQLVDPARLGYRKMAETGRSAYEPHPDLAAVPSAAFPRTDLGTGVPAPPPTVPTVLALAHSRRTHLIHQAKPTERVLTARRAAAAGLLLELGTQRAALFHALQHVRLSARVPAQALLFGTAGVGSPEAETLAQISGNGAYSAAELLLPAAPEPAFPLQGLAPSFYDPAQIRALITLLHDPVAGAVGSAFDVLGRLLGALGRSYGAAEITPPGTMDADGPYRTLLATFSPASLPSVDALLDQVADGRQLRDAVGALATLLLRIIQGPILQGLPLHLQPPPLGNLALVNGGVASSGLAFVLSLYRSTATSSETSASPPRDVLVDLVALHAALAPPVAAPGPGDDIVPGYPYLAPAPPSAAGTLPAARLVVLGTSSSGATLFLVEPGPTGADDRVEWAPAQSFPVRALAESGAGDTLNVFAGSTVVVSHPAGLAPDAAQSSDILAWRQLPDADAVEIALPHNLAAGSVVFSWNSGAVVTTLQMADSPLTTLAKMLLIASNYAASADGVALVAADGEGGPDADDEAESRLCRASFLRTALGASPHAHLLAEELAQLALRTADIPMTDVSGNPTDPLRALLSLARLNEHPFSADWASNLPQRVRPERLGFAEGEFAAPLVRGSVFVGAMASPNDVDRSGPPYLLMDVQVNGEAGAGAGAGAGRSASAPSSYQYGSTQGELFSLGSSSRADRDRQVIRCVAYVQAGGDGSSLRLLDKQDDRSPVLFPTAFTLSRVRFRFLRPDGSLYDFAGRKVMVALRFFTQAETPNAFDLGKDKERAGPERK